MIDRNEVVSRDEFPMWGPRTQGTAELEWSFDPVAESLSASAGWQQSAPEYPKPFCIEAGRRLLRAQLEMSSWILRRVEKIDLTAEQAVRRRVTLEFIVPQDAPVFIDHDGRRLRCVPLSLMRRRTLVGLDIRDEEGRSLSLPGLRMAQSLDQSLLLAAAACRLCRDPNDGLPEGVYSWIEQAVCGQREAVHEAYEHLIEGRTPALLELSGDDLFMNVALRLRRNFTLFVFLDERELRHRLLRISFEEPTDWRYQKPALKPVEAPGPLFGYWEYEPGTPCWTVRGALARFGLRSTRIRFQVPAAEAAASFHFELSAPPGVQIVKAILLGGRPNDTSERSPSFDLVRGHSPTVGLHAVEVPSGSLCRVQADFRVTARGWLSTMMVATFAIAALMVTVLVHSQERSQLKEGEVTNAVLLLVTAVAAAAALVAQRDFVGMAARFVTGVRTVVTVALGLPIVAAGFLVFRGPSQVFDDDSAYKALEVLTALSFLAFALAALAWGESWFKEGRRLVQESPWDMTRPSIGPSKIDMPRSEERFKDVVKRFRFDSSAVGVASAEGWYSFYGWDNRKHQAAIRELERAFWDHDVDGRPGWQRFSTAGAPRVTRSGKVSADGHSEGGGSVGGEHDAGGHGA